VASAIPHGTLDGYCNHRCRCLDCRDIWTDYCADLRHVREERLAKDPTLIEHGTTSSYNNWRCRCRPCKDAHSAYRRELYARNQGIA
jgi:hypothetical protein